MPTIPDSTARQTWRVHLRDLKSFDDELARILSDAAREADRILRLNIDDSVSARVRRAQHQQSAKAIRQLIAEMYDGPITRAMRESIERTTLHAMEGLNEINGLLFKKARGTIVTDGYEYAARRAIEHVRSRLINDIRLSRKVYKTRALSQKWVQREINRALLLGRSADELARAVRAMIAPNVEGGVSYASRRLARTEINNAFHTTTIRMASPLPWTEGFKWNLSGSHPRPDICNEFADDDHSGLGAGIFSTADVPSKPHPQCLCYLTVVSIDEDEFLDRLIAGQYDGWLRRQSP